MPTNLLERPALNCPDIVSDTTRRQFLAGLAAAGLLAAGDSAEMSGPTQTETRTIETMLGKQRVPVAPQRVAMLDGYTGLDTAVLDAAPMAGLSRNPSRPHTGVPDYVGAADLADLPDLGWIDIAVEQVAAVNPDLIIDEAYGLLA